MALKRSTGLVNAMAGHETTLVSNGKFTSDTTGWTAVDASLASAANGQDGNCLEITESGGANPGKAYQDITTLVGHIYKLEFYFKKGTSDYGKVMIGTMGDEDAIHDTGNLSDASWTKYTVLFIATATTTRITLESVDATAGEISYFDEVALYDKAGSLRDVFEGNAVIEIRSGSQPSSADAAPTGTLLVTISDNATGNGLHFNDAVAGVLALLTGQINTGVAVADGTAGWFRIKNLGDSGASSTTDPRVDGAVATSGAELNISSTTIANGATQTISSLSLQVKMAA